MLKTILDSKGWQLLCSLKLAIVLASAVSLLTVGGSLLMPFNPKVFAGMDSMPLGLWIERLQPRLLA